MIEDLEIKNLFQAESAEHLESLRHDVKELVHSFSPSLIDQLFRGAHTIKGSARMLKLSEVEKTAHEMEEILEPLRKNKQAPSLEEIEKFQELIAILEGQIQEALTEEKKEPISFPNSMPAPSSVRVQTSLINTLISQAGNLATTKNRCYRLIEMLDATHSFVEEQTGPGISTFHTINSQISEIRQEAFEQISRLDRLTTTLSTHIQQLGQIPLAKLFDLFSDTVQETAMACGKEVDLILSGKEILVDKHIIDDMKDSLMHILRNAVVHGIETPQERVQKGKPKNGTITLRAQQISDQLWIEVSDDGRGLDLVKIKNKIKKNQGLSETEIDKLSTNELINYIFLPGFSTLDSVTDLAGRGVGMDVVKRQVEELEGVVFANFTPDLGTHFSIKLPTTVMMTSLLLIKSQELICGIPIEAVYKIELIDQTLLTVLENRFFLNKDKGPLPVLFIEGILNEDSLKEPLPFQIRPCLILQIGYHQTALFVDAILEEQHAVITPFPQLLLPFPWCSGAAILKNGQVAVILNPFYLMKTVEKHLKTILLVDDSPTIFAYYRDILQKKGFRVIGATDGLDALEKLATLECDGVVSDLQMPRMDGMTLLQTVMHKDTLKGRPFIMLTSLDSSEMRQKALKEGASGYVIKNSEGTDELVSLLNQLLT